MQLEIGLGGDLQRSRFPAAEPWLDHILIRVAHADSAARVPCIEGRYDRADAAACRARGCPVRQFTDLYDVRSDGLDRLRANLDLAAAMGDVEALGLQVAGDAHSPTIDECMAFYEAALPLAKTYGIRLATETHIDRFTYDPRRLWTVHCALSHLGGLRVSADFSHYVHQIGNPTVPHAADIRSGALVLDPDRQDCAVNRIIDAGLVDYGHLRMAIPNDRGRDGGSIQYPVSEPLAEDGSGPVPLQIASAWGGGWRVDPTRTWWAWYGRLFAEVLARPSVGVVRCTTEFINYERDYRIDPYSNVDQNINMLVLAQRLIRASPFIGASASVA